uniref:DOP1 leucine zipper like protein B n=1 Tax=Poecilia formosa TaxID=48698 RepID=A0A096LUB2_POEFO
MAVKPVLLTLYERYYLPLQRALLPSLQAFVTGLLPGLEEGLEVYDRTDALLVKLSLLVGQQVFFGALWGSMLVTPMVRLPASVFVVTHFDRMAPLSQQTYMLGYGHHAVELYADIQSLFLPNMLGTMLQSLHRHMDSISLDDITQGLRVCFKVLSKIQMPVAYMDVDAGANTEERESASPEEETANEDERETRDQGGEAEPANGVYSTLRSEDSGLGVSASPSEQHLQLGMATEAKRNGTCKTGDGVWRRGGSVEAMTRSLQDILAFITTSLDFRYLMVQVEDVADPDPEPQRDQSTNSGDQKSLSRGREIKHKLSELFTPNKRKASVSPDTPLPPSPTEKKKERGSSVCLDWAAGYMPRGKAEISEACRQTFVATCHLLLESTTFPVYLSEEEMLALYTDMFGHSGRDVDGLPVWLRSLMILCCMSRDYNIQHTAMASLLELINHSQSLALVIEDKHRRYQSSDNNPLSGRLQMVSVPPIYPVLHRAIEEHTDFFQRLSRVLWSQLDTEQREQHVSCVDLFYRLHCLAPSASICEDIICQALLHKDKAIRLEALHRFTVLWHLTRETQCSRTMSLSRSFDRSLCVVVDSLTSADGSISAAAQCWLVRALSLNDVIRILEPILLLLLHPSTQRCSIQSVKQNLTAELLNGRRSLIKTSRTPADMVASDVTTLSSLDVVDREALWAELESGPEPQKPEEALPASRSESEGTEEDEVKEEEEEDAESEHTESADTSGALVSTENSSSGSAPPSSVEEGGLLNGLRRVESEHTQASDSLSSEEEEDFELEAMARSRLLKQEREKREAIDSLFRHVLLYPAAAGGWRHLLQGLALLDSLLRSSPECHLVDALCCTSLDTSSAAHLNLVSNLLQRHQQAQDGRCFYGCLLSPTSSPSAPPSLLVELLVSLCLQILRSHYPSYLSLTPLDLQGNMEVQVKSVTVLTRIVKQLCFTVRGQECSKATLESIHRLLTCCKVQQYALLSLSASMYVSQKAADKGASKGAELLDEAGGLSEESLVNLGAGGGGQEQCPLQIELLKLLQALIVLEYHPGDPRESSPASTPLAREWQTAVLFQQSIKAAQYVQSHPITAQGMFVSAAARALQPQYGYAMHPHWVSLLCSSLPYLGRSLGIIVSPLISQICKNMDDLVKLHEHEGGKANHSLTGRKENIAPDYPLTLLEGLTTITHYCLLDNKKSLVACDPVDVRNARNAVLEALPQMLSSMALLWGVVVRDEFQRRASDSGHSSKHASTSVYFKSSKILRQRILQFLLPLTGHYGVQLMASVGVVWSSRKSKRRHKNQVLPVASEARLVVVELIKSLHTLNIETVLHLVKEVVKRPHQIKGEQKATLVDIPMLQFSYAYVQSISAAALQENVAPLLSLLRESVQLNLAPPGHFLLLGILNDFVNRLPNLDSKKDSKDLQEVTQRILETVGGIAGSSLEQTSWLSRSLEVKVQPQVCVEAEEPDDAEVDGDHCEANAMVSSSAPSVYSVQALTLLAEILAPLLDMVYRSDEKEKAVPLISRLLYYVFPYLKNHSAYNMPSFAAGAQLLSSLSGYACTKRAWKKEVFELFMDPLFFTMDASCAHSWKSIIDHLLTHEKTMFKDLMGMQSSSLKLFPSADQKPMLLKRQAFAMFSGELDQYHLYLPLIQERLTDTLRMNSSPAVSAQMFLMFRVLLLRISSQHLTSLWPIMVTELIRIFARLEKSLQPEKDVSKWLTKVVRGALDKNGPVNFSNAELDMYLSACKFLDTSLAFPPEKMPLFQMYRWAFVPEVDVSRYSGPENTLIEGEQECTQHVVRVLEGIQQRYGALNGLTEESSTDNLEFPLLTQSSLSSITQLLPFLRTLCCSFQAPAPSGQPAAHFAVAEYPAPSSHIVLSRLEGIIENEFLDSMVIKLNTAFNFGDILNDSTYPSTSDICSFIYSNPNLSPKFLHTNSTSHTWPFSAIAELIALAPALRTQKYETRLYNAYDPDVSAKQFWIDKTMVKGEVCLSFMDNGNGLDHETMHKMLSFGYSDKMAVNGLEPIGIYGNGFKSGSMRLGKDAIVFSKSKSISCIGMLSQTYLEKIGAKQIIIPIISFETVAPLSVKEKQEASLKDILQYSLFKSHEELLAEIDAITSTLSSTKTGTRIIIWNLRRTSSGSTEFDFDRDRYDIRIPSEVYEELSDPSRPLNRSTSYVPESVISLREYCSILYLKPRMQVMVRGQKVKSQLIAKSLAYIRKDHYKPTFLDKRIPIIFGYNTKSKDQYGIMMYHKNRLIKAYERVGCQLKANMKGVGVIGVIECNFLDPTHNKQSFNETDKYRKTINSLGTKLEEYWNEIRFRKTKEDPNSTVPVEDTMKRPDQNWVQCDSCLRWRKLPDGIDVNKLPDKWYCLLNPDPQFRSCKVEEEPEDSDDDQPSYRKTYKQQSKMILALKNPSKQLKTRSLLLCPDAGKPEDYKPVHIIIPNPFLLDSNRLGISFSPELQKGKRSQVVTPQSTPKRPRVNGFQPGASDTPVSVRIDSSDTDETDDDDIVILETASTPKPKQPVGTLRKVKQEKEESENQIPMVLECTDDAAVDETSAATAEAETCPPTAVASATTQTTAFEVKEEQPSQNQTEGNGETASRSGSTPDLPVEREYPNIDEVQKQQDQLVELMQETAQERDALREQLKLLTSQLEDMQSRLQEQSQAKVKESSHQACQTDTQTDYKGLFERAKQKINDLIRDKEALLAANESKSNPNCGQDEENDIEEISLKVSRLVQELDERNKEREELRLQLDNLEEEKSTLAAQCEELKLRMQQQRENAQPSAGSRTSGTNSDASSCFSSIPLFSLIELRQNVGRLLVSRVPALDLAQVNFECNVIDEILEQVLTGASQLQTC